MISVIVPVYNAEKVVGRCIESVILQTYVDWELILVDDGSNDQSISVCEKYAHKDSRIRIIHQENQGPSKARNTGINAAKGDYICFIDSDDYVSPNYLSDFNIDKDVDFVVQGMELIYINERLNKKYIPLKTIVCNLDKALEETSIYVLLYGPCCKAFKTSILRENNIVFPLNIHYGEDRIFVLKYMRYCSNNVKIISTANYYYMHENVASLTAKRKESIELGLSSLLQYRELKKLIAKISINKYSLYYRKELMLDTYQSVYNNIFENKFKIWQSLSYIRRLDKELMQFVYKEKSLPCTFYFIKYLVKLLRIGK